MRISKNIAVVAATLAVANLSLTGLAQQDSSTQTTPGSSSQSSSSASSDLQSSSSSSQSQTQTSVRLSKLMEADVKSQSDEDLGGIEDVIVDTKSGKVSFVVLGRGGFLGIGEKLVPVPWNAFKVSGEDQVAVNFTKDKFQNAPTVESDYAKINDTTFMTSIQQHFQAGDTAVGGSEADTSTDTGASESDSPDTSVTPDTSDPVDTSDDSATDTTHPTPDQPK